MTLILSEGDVERVLTMAGCLEVLDHTFRDYGLGKAVSRPRTHTYTPRGEKTFYNFKSMDGAVPRYGVHALRFSSEVVREVTVAGRTREEKLPLAPGGRYVGLVLLFDLETTEPLAIIQEAGLQRMRVGATSGLAAKYLSRENSEVVGMFGVGWQALPQLEALLRVRNIREVVVYSPTRANRRAFARATSDRLHVPVRPLDEPRDVVRGADIVVCATNSLVPVFDGSWLEPGQHVNSLQAGELDRATHERADVISVRSREVSRHYVQADSRETPGHTTKTHAFNQGFEDKTVELGRVMAGLEDGRRSAEQITLFGGSGTGPSSGLGIQFAAVAKLVFDAARSHGIGREIPTEWLLEEHHP